MSPARRLLLGLAIAGLLAGGGPAQAQNARDAERRLERVRKELKDVAGERRRVEGERGEAARELRRSDEQVASSTRALRQVESGVAQEHAALAALQPRRDALQATMAAQREELRALLRAAYMSGDDAPLKLLLAQDRVADTGRALAYNGYLQRQRAARIAALRTDLAELDALEREIAARRSALETARQEQQRRLAALERDRRQRSEAVASLEQRYRDSSSRERALGRDARSLEQLLTRLRAAAARAQAARRTQPPAAGPPRRAGTATARATAPVQVGGLGWPLAGTLLAGYGARLPDGRSSSGVLIGAPAGTPVKAVADGTVVFSEWMTGYGMILIVDHGDGYMSLYAHNDALLKDAGDRVKRGDTVASVGNSGGQGRTALYFELRRNGQPVNPGSWLQRR